MIFISAKQAVLLLTWFVYGQGIMKDGRKIHKDARRISFNEEVTEEPISGNDTTKEAVCQECDFEDEDKVSKNRPSDGVVPEVFLVCSEVASSVEVNVTCKIAAGEYFKCTKHETIPLSDDSNPLGDDAGPSSGMMSNLRGNVNSDSKLMEAPSFNGYAAHQTATHLLQDTESKSIGTGELTTVVTDEWFGKTKTDEPTNVDTVAPNGDETNEPTIIDTDETTVGTITFQPISSAPSLPLCTTSAPWAGVLVFFGLKPDCVLPECAGHCNSDSDCATDLFCFESNSSGMREYFPGCETIPYENVNYCIADEYKPPPSELSTTEPSISPTIEPSTLPSQYFEPSMLPTSEQSEAPSRIQTIKPTIPLSLEQTVSPSGSHTAEPSISPTPTMNPTQTPQCSPIWKQLGNTIGIVGSNFAMATERLVIAVPQNSSIHVFSFSDHDTSWDRTGEAIDPKFASSNASLFILALSSNGDVVAIGDQAHDQKRGRVKVFALHPDNVWIQLGKDISGESTHDKSGYSLAISADGTTVAIGAVRNTGSYGHSSGQVRMYKYTHKNETWTQMGGDLDGEASNDYSGTSIALSRDGFIVAIGAPCNDDNGNQSGHIRIYSYQHRRWTQLGGDIDGKASDDQSGWSVAMSADGFTVIIGARYNSNSGSRSGHVRIYGFNHKKYSWIQRGGDIDGDAKGNELGYSVAMAADGKTIAIGAHLSDGTARNAGHIRVYQFDTVEKLWIQKGSDLDGDTANDNFGKVVSISADGAVVGGSGGGTKNLKISKWTSCATPPPSCMPSVTPNCADGKHTFQLDITTDHFPKQTTWNVKNIEDETVLSGGPYNELSTPYSESYCLDLDCFKFTIQDSASDGVCCESGNGKYKLFVDSLLIKEGGDFTIEESSVPFGATCTSSAPSITPSMNACPIGTFVNYNLESKCEACPPGSYQDEETYSETCKKCDAGTYQSEEGKSICNPCERGSYQIAVGKTKCNKCRAGGYCDAGLSNTWEGGFKPCQDGTYNSEKGKYNATACLPCPAGTYADKDGLTECLTCPYRLGSIPNSTFCSFCEKDFYLADPNVNFSALLERPEDLCKTCPQNVKCPRNTTIETFHVLPNYWRDSISTAKIYPCNYDGVCGSNQAKFAKQSQQTLYCKDGHSGPLCEFCGRGKYLKEMSGTCNDCPAPARSAGIIFLILSISVALVIGYMFVTHSPYVKQRIDRISSLTSCLSLQAKLKIIISFYQVVNVLESAYGVRIEDNFKEWFNLLRYFDFRILDYVIPQQCFGSMKAQLLLTSTWPFILLGIVVIGIFLYTTCLGVNTRNSRKLREKIFHRSLHLAIVVVYVLLPSVSNTIFDAIRCKSFVTDDMSGKVNSYLIEDGLIKCEASNPEYQEILYIFWMLFTLWPVIMPLLFTRLLWNIRKSVMLDHITGLSEACRFLWQDYKKNMMFWEVLDVVRKIFLTGLIMFVDKEQGSERMIRLVLAIFVSTIYMGILALARPYKRTNDLYISFISNILLIGCFLMGIVIHTCNEDNDSCHRLIGLLDLYNATLLAVTLAAGMLVISAIIIIVVAKVAVPDPTILVKSTKSRPNLGMSDECYFHVFLSHVLATGHDKTHKFARMMQLCLPGVRIWLDVEDELDNSKLLERSVADSEIFVLFYSIGYFRSEDCRREVSTAVSKRKPVLLLYEDDALSTIEVECTTYFKNDSYSDTILSHILKEDPILWLGGSTQPFASMSVKIVALRLLKCLPYYNKHSEELDQGLQLGIELDSSKFLKPQKIFVCEANAGVMDVIEELEEEDRKKVTFADNYHFIMQPVSGAVDTVLLLYLNDNLFQGKSEIVQKVLSKSFTDGVKIILVQEKDDNKGHCDFKQLTNQTPRDLLALGLFSNIAIPLYTTAEYRKISMYLVLEEMSSLCTPEQKK